MARLAALRRRSLGTLAILIVIAIELAAAAGLVAAVITIAWAIGQLVEAIRSLL